MYNELVSIGKDGNVFLEDKSIALMPAMWKVYKSKKGGSKQVRWIVCVYDYKSPYRRLPEDERKARVSQIIFGTDKLKNPQEKNVDVQDAIKEYVNLQYDPLIDQYNAMSEQAYKVTKEFRKITATKDNIDEINDMQKKMFTAAESREKIKQMILKDQESESKIQGTGSDNFSLIEQEQRLSE